MRGSRGFTLLEVLIAGVILFMVVGTGTVVYTSALKSTSSAMNALERAAYVPILIESIKSQIRVITETKEYKGDGGLPDGSRYRWTAVIKDSLPALQVFSEESGGFSDSAKTIELWQVELVLNDGRTTRQIEFVVTGGRVK